MRCKSRALTLMLLRSTFRRFDSDEERSAVERVVLIKALDLVEGLRRALSMSRPLVVAIEVIADFHRDFEGGRGEECDKRPERDVEVLFERRRRHQGLPAFGSPDRDLASISTSQAKSIPTTFLGAPTSPATTCPMIVRPDPEGRRSLGSRINRTTSPLLRAVGRVRESPDLLRPLSTPVIGPPPSNL